MQQPSDSEARRMLHSDAPDVVRPWEEDERVVEAGADDTTAPGLPASGGAAETEPPEPDTPRDGETP